MTPGDVATLLICGGIVVLLVGGFIALTIVKLRKRAARLELFREACRSLGLTHGEDDWYGERDGVRVGVSWMECPVGHNRNANTSIFTQYDLRFEPPLRTGMVLYTGVERYVSPLKGTETHVASIEHWNELPLPTGGQLWDVQRAPKAATVHHVHVEHPISEKACVYAADPEQGRRQMTGPFAERLQGLVDGTAFCWFDDSRLIVLVRGDGDGPQKQWVTTTDLVDLHLPHADAEHIGAWLTKLAELGNDLRRLAA